MYAQQTSNIDLSAIGKSLSIVASALIITFGLFVAMDKLTSTDKLVINSPLETVIIDPVYNEPDEILVEAPRKLSPPQVKEIPTAIPKNIDDMPEDLMPGVGAEFTLSAPIVKNTFSTTFAVTDGDVRPIVRVEPKYPIEATRNGIEGWAKLSFTINTIGQVIDVKVLDAEPKRVFDREASRALKKWKYHPQVVDGVPVAKSNMVVVLDFKLAREE
jgi:protein TonB